MSEVVVVGGGVTGASASYRLIRRGVATTLVDRFDIGQATAAGLGIVACHLTEPTTVDPGTELVRLSCEYYRELVPWLASDGERGTGYGEVGALYLATDDHEREQLSNNLGLALSRGDVTRLDNAEARRLFPPLRPDAEVVHIPNLARVDGRLLGTP